MNKAEDFDMPLPDCVMDANAQSASVLLPAAELFVEHARTDIHAVRFFDNGKNRWGYKPVPQPFDAELLRRHLNGGPHLGA